MQDETAPYYEAFDPDAEDPFDDEELDSAAEDLDELDDEDESEYDDDSEDLEWDDDEDEDECDDGSDDSIDPSNPPVTGPPQTLVV